MATIGPIDNNQLLSTTNNVEFATLGIGVAPATSDVKIAAGNRIGAWITGTNVSSGADADGLFIDTAFAPSASIVNAASIGLYPTMNPPMGVTITTGYGLYIASGTFAGAGAVTTGYGLFVTSPTIATTNITAQLDNIRLDSNTIQATNLNGTLDVNSAGTGTLSLGTNATNHQVTVGSVSGTSSTTVQSGSGALAVTSTGGTLTINSGVGALGISTDASATTISIGTGGAVKGITLGSTNSTSSLALKSGSGNIVANSGLTVDSTGQMTNAVQSTFYAYQSANSGAATGDGTLFTIVCDTEVYDVGGNYNNTTGVFTAPVTGIYHFDCILYAGTFAAGHTGLLFQLTLSTGTIFPFTQYNPFAVTTSTIITTGSITVKMTASDTAKMEFTVSGGAKTVVSGGGGVSGNRCVFSGILLA